MYKNISFCSSDTFDVEGYMIHSCLSVTDLHLHPELIDEALAPIDKPDKILVLLFKLAHSQNEI